MHRLASDMAQQRVMQRLGRNLVLAVNRNVQQTPNRLKQLSAATSWIKWERPFNNTSAMGLVTSTQRTSPESKTEGERDDSFYKSVKLISAPEGKASDALDLSITLNKEIRLQLHQAKVVGLWKLELEIDIAQLQERHKLIEQPTNFENEYETIHISEDSLARIVRGKTTEMMANICAIHIKLHDQEDNAISDDLVVIMDVSHGGYENVGSPAHLTRRLYGIESDFARSRWPS